jgi:hypothetical protein
LFRGHSTTPTSVAGYSAGKATPDFFALDPKVRIEGAFPLAVGALVGVRATRATRNG